MSTKIKLEDFYKFLDERNINYFKTGSSEFGCSISSSDLDICILDNPKSIIFEELTKHFSDLQTKTCIYSNGYYLTNIKNSFINIIPLESLTMFVSWYDVTNIIKQNKMFDHNYSLSKDERIIIFEQLLSICKFINKKKTAFELQNIVSNVKK